MPDGVPPTWASSEGTGSIGCLLLVDPEPGREAALGRLRLALGRSIENARILEDGLAAASWLLENPANILVVVIGGHVHPWRRPWDVERALERLMESTSPPESIADRLVVVLIDKQGYVHEPMFHGRWSVEGNDGLSANIDFDLDFWYPPLRPSWSRLGELLRRMGFDGDLGGGHGHIRLRSRGEGRRPLVIVLDGERVLGGLDARRRPAPSAERFASAFHSLLE